MKQKLIVVLGPTAVGKTRFAVNLANIFNGEIISADSRQVYRRMDIGSGKDIDDYIIDGKKIPYHLIDVLEPTEEFDLFKFQSLFYDCFHNIIDRNHLPFLVGGTGLYINSIIKNYELSETNFNSERKNELEKLTEIELIESLFALKTELHNTTDLLEKDRIIKAIQVAEQNSAKREINRPKIDSLVLGIPENREQIKNNITIRLKYRLDNGMIEEVQSLVNSGISFEKLNYFGLEYKYVGRYLKGELNYNDMFQKLNSSIHKFAKRQMTWFRKMEREGIKINWIDKTNLTESRSLIQAFLEAE